MIALLAIDEQMLIAAVVEGLERKLVRLTLDLLQTQNIGAILIKKCSNEIDT